MNTSSLDVFIYVLGTAQDAGYPQVGCKKICCRNAWNNKVAVRLPSCIAIVNKKLKKYWLIDITPEIKAQLHLLDDFDCELAGIFITHAHSGHYMGLFNLGKLFSYSSPDEPMQGEKLRRFQLMGMTNRELNELLEILVDFSSKY